MWETTDVLGVLLMVAAVTMVVSGIVNAVLWSRSGGMIRGFARLATDPARSRRFVLYLSAILGSFLALAVLESARLLLPPDNLPLRFASAIVVLVGATGTVVLTLNGMPGNELSLSEELRLEEEHPEILDVVERQATGPAVPAKSSMYVFPRLEH
jgi:hypothetical protein